MPKAARLQATVDKLLIYGPGQFFRPHRDSERSDHMVASLVIDLPSEYTGGELVVSHDEESMTCELRTRANSLDLVAFYADCVHEVRPVTSGFRLVLVYRLELEADGDLQFDELVAADESVVAAVAEELREVFWSPDGGLSGWPRKMVFVLDHHYTERNLRWELLKSDDRRRAAILRQVADRLQLRVFLAVAELHEHWTADPEDCEGDFYGGYGVRTEGDDVPEVDELIDSGLEVRHWLDAAGERVDLPEMGVDQDDELVCGVGFDTYDPDGTEYEGFMGNYGNTVDRWYRRAAVVLWPEGHDFLIRAERSCSYAVRELLRICRGGDKEAAVAKFRMLSSDWRHRLVISDDRNFTAESLELAAELGDRDIAETLLGPVRLEHLESGALKPWARLLDLYGVDWCFARWQAWKGYQGADDFPWRLLVVLISESPDAGRQLVRLIVRDAMTAWVKNLQPSNSGRIHVPERVFMENSAHRARELLEVLAATQDEKAWCEVADRLMAKDDPFGPEQQVSVALDLLEGSGAGVVRVGGVERLLRCGLSALESRLAAPERVAGDWRMVEMSSCDCGDCGGLNRFLQSPEQSLRWPLNQQRRRHIHQVIDDLELPVSHETVRQGSPYILMLAKTERLFTDEAEFRDKGKQLAVKAAEALSEFE